MEKKETKPNSDLLFSSINTQPTEIATPINRFSSASIEKLSERLEEISISKKLPKMFDDLVDLFTGGGNAKVKGTVVLMKKNVLDFNDFNASFLDRLHEFLGNKVSLRLISSDASDPGDSRRSSNFHFPV